MCVCVLWLDMAGHGWTWLPSSGELFAARQGIPNYQFPIAKWLVQDLSCWDVDAEKTRKSFEITCNFLVWKFGVVQVEGGWTKKLVYEMRVEGFSSRYEDYEA